MTFTLRKTDHKTLEHLADHRILTMSQLTAVYRHIRNGELEAVDLVDANGKIALKGHYRITRSSLNQFLESRKVKPLADYVAKLPLAQHLPKVKNHLGL